MIETKIIVRQKKQGNSTGGTPTGAASIQQGAIDHALTAEKAKRADVADKAGYADSAGYAARAGYASKAGELDEDAEVLERFLRKDQEDSTEFLLRLLAGAVFGKYKYGVSGASIDKDGNAEFGTLLTRLKATLAELLVEKDAHVGGDSTFDGNLSSEDFVSGFIGGKGWAISKREVLNALGVPETKYTGEFDDIVVRGAIRVFSLIISQLLGENDNRIFTGMMEVDHYDPATGRVYLSTHDGKMYNPFRKDDYIMVQQYNGMPSEENDHYITKHYECIITAAGCGDESDGENRLDWVEISNFISADGRAADAVISKGDTFTRVDNATDADRKGLIQIITVGSATPYMDVVYGMKTDPDNSLKGRLGNLQGIHHHLFGWLDGFGELLTNLYAVGDFRLRRTGESIDAKIEMLKAVFATRYSDLRHELTDDDNYLYNATFDETMDGWSVEDDGKVITSNGEALLMNGNTYIADGRIAGVEHLDGRNVLHLKRSGIRQKNALIRKPGTHKEYAQATESGTSDEYVEVKDTLYVNVRFLAKTDGTLTIGMSGATPEPGSLPAPASVAVIASMEWQELQWQGTWDGKGDFLLEYSGDMYVSVLSVTDRALDDFKKEVSTQIIQTASNIRLLGTNINNLKGTVTQLGIELDAAEERISIYADKYDKLNGTVTNLGVRLDAAEGQISIYADKYDELNETVTNLGVRLDAAEGQISIYADKYDRLNNTVTRLGIRLDAAEGSITNYATRIGNNETAISALQIKADSISSAVTGVQGDLATAKSRIEAVAAVANSAGDAKVYNQANNPWLSWPSGTEHKYVGATWYNTTDGHIYRYIGYDNSNSWEDITNEQDSASYILQNKGKISTVVGSFDAAGNLTNTSGLVTTSYASQIYATKTSVDALSGRVSTAEASIDVHSTQIAMRVEKNGVISAINQSAESVSISASKINFNGMVTMNNSFRVEVDGTTHIGGFVVSGNGLTNGPDFSNDAYVIFRNDAHKCFAGIGGNVLLGSSGIRGVARFENYDTSDWWGLGHNYAMLVGSRGAADCTAIAITGGSVSGLAIRTLTIGHDSITQSSVPTTKSISVGRDVGSIYVSTHFNWRSSSSGKFEDKTREIRLTLPNMETYDDGHVIFIKRGPNNGNWVNVIPGASKYMSGSSTVSGNSYILYDDVSYATPSSPMGIESEGDAMCLIYHRDISVTISGVTYHGCWAQHKFPRRW